MYDESKILINLFDYKRSQGAMNLHSFLVTESIHVIRNMDFLLMLVRVLQWMIFPHLNWMKLGMILMMIPRDTKEMIPLPSLKINMTIWLIFYIHHFLIHISWVISRISHSLNHLNIGSWIMDSGANDHCYSSIKFFDSYKKISQSTLYYRMAIWKWKNIQ